MKTKASRKVRVYIKIGSIYYSFCWVEFLKDGSWSFGLTSRGMPWKEFGTAVYRVGKFIGHVQTLTTGNTNKKDIYDLHITFHPPRIEQKSGIVHFVDNEKKIDEWALDWYPVTKAQTVICVSTGIVDILRKTQSLKKNSHIVDIPRDVEFLQMTLSLYPRSTKLTDMHNPKALGNIHGYAPGYIVSCQFYKQGPTPLYIYVASDRWEVSNGN